MSNISIHGFNLHRVNVNSSSPDDVAFPADLSFLEKYISIVLNDVINSPRSCQYKFDEPLDVVPSRLASLIEGNKRFEDVSQDIVLKLHMEEVAIQSVITKLGNSVSKGVLIQVYFEHEGRLKYLIIKVDDNEFLEINSLKLTDGLPSEHTRTQKAALIEFESQEISGLLISDSKSPITKYWYKEFLHASSLNSSEKNTKDSFEYIDKVLNVVKGKSKYDYWLIRNDVISYYRNNEGFLYSDIVSRIENHVFENKDVVKSEVKGFEEGREYRLKEVLPSVVRKLENLPSDKGFDTQFNIQSNVIRAKLVNKIVLDRYFDLSIKGDIEDLGSKIVAGDDDDGKYIKIYSDEGYEHFYKGESEKDNGEG